MPNAFPVVLALFLGFNSVALAQVGTLADTGPLPWVDGQSRCAMTRLPDGRILATGGYLTSTLFYDRCSLYDPASGTWTIGASIPGARVHHASVLLPDGRVLIAGGTDASGAVRTCALYSPATDTWTAAPDLPPAATGEVASVLMANGRVLVMSISGACHEFDPAGSGRWITLPSLPAPGRWLCPLTRLLDGRILLTGGSLFTGSLQRTCYIYSPDSASWSPVAPMATARRSHAAVLLPTGRVLVVGGLDNAAANTCEEYDPVSDSWATRSPMAAGRIRHDAFVLGSGAIFAGGGQGYRTYSHYDPPSDLWTDGEAYPWEWQPFEACLLASGQVLIGGAFSTTAVGKPRCVLFTPVLTGSEPTADIRSSARVSPLRVPIAFSAGASTDLDGGPLHYLWNFGDPASGSANTSTSAVPVHRFLLAGSYTVTLTVTDDEGQQAMTQARIEVVAAPTTYAAWRSLMFTPAEQADPLVSGQAADPDGDQVPNLQEYAFAMDPKVDSVFGLPSVSIENWRLAYDHNEYRAGGDLLFDVDFATAITGPWASGPTVVQEVSRAADGLLDRVKVHSVADIRSTPSGFLRLRITRAGEATAFWPASFGTASLGAEPPDPDPLPDDSGSQGRCGSIGFDLLLLPAALLAWRRWGR